MPDICGIHSDVEESCGIKTGMVQGTKIPCLSFSEIFPLCAGMRDGTSLSRFFLSAGISIIALNIG